VDFIKAMDRTRSVSNDRKTLSFWGRTTNSFTCAYVENPTRCYQMPVFLATSTMSLSVEPSSGRSVR